LNVSFKWQALRERKPGALPLIMAHRGASDELPENTLAAFRRALAQGADILETDIRFTRDDEIVIMHDATVDRTTLGTGAAAAMTLSEFKRLRARMPEQPRVLTELAEQDPAEAPPTLGEFLELTAEGQVPVALELKDDRFMNSRDAGRLIALLDKYKALGRTVLLSFRGARVRACKRLAPEVPIGIITLKNPLPLYDTELMGPFYPLLYFNPFYFAWARRRGKIACPLDPAPEPRLGLYYRLGAPVLLTNHPRVTIEAWRRIPRG
jgi:glycerophosphoryl diester phosphodiesterase